MLISLVSRSLTTCKCFGDQIQNISITNLFVAFRCQTVKYIFIRALLALDLSTQTDTHTDTRLNVLNKNIHNVNNRYASQNKPQTNYCLKNPALMKRRSRLTSVRFSLSHGMTLTISRSTRMFSSAEACENQMSFHYTPRGPVS